MVKGDVSGRQTGRQRRREGQGSERGMCVENPKKVHYLYCDTNKNIVIEQEEPTRLIY